MCQNFVVDEKNPLNRILHTCTYFAIQAIMLVSVAIKDPRGSKALDLELYTLQSSVIGKTFLPMGHFQLFSIILKFSMGHFLYSLCRL